MATQHPELDSNLPSELLIPLSGEALAAARNLAPLLLGTTDEKSVVLRALSVLHRAVGYKVVLEDAAGAHHYVQNLWRGEP